VHNARPVVVALVDEDLGNEFLDLERWKSGNLGRKEMARSAFIADRGGRKDEITDFQGALR
jgi:hypothetical protein